MQIIEYLRLSDRGFQSEVDQCDNIVNNIASKIRKSTEKARGGEQCVKSIHKPQKNEEQKKLKRKENHVSNVR